MHEVHAHLRSRMESMGMTVRVDAAGNLRGLWRAAGRERQAARCIGSHIDTVPDAGAFDGVLGVVLALEWVEIAQELKSAARHRGDRILRRRRRALRRSLHWQPRGCRALRSGAARTAKMRTASRWQTRFAPSVSIRPRSTTPRSMRSVLGFVEIHIEQGPVLEAEDLSVAVVTGIVGQTRLTLEFTGQANHAGTTPMRLRHDALAGCRRMDRRSGVSSRSGLRAWSPRWARSTWNPTPAT